MYTSEGYPVCVNCGYCCKKVPCAYGTWDSVASACKYLTDKNLCGIYDQVKHDQVNPAMGAGCCSTMFNSLRDKKLKELSNE